MRIATAWQVRVALLLALAVMAPRLPAQGALTPPPGAPTPVMKTLSEVEPRVAVQSLSGITSVTQYLINKPGSYYLADNIKGVAGLYAIQITTAGVTLDLTGFTVAGVPGTGSGIVASASRVTVRNGFVRDWGSHGLITGYDSFVENITATNNSGVGIYTSDRATVRNCHASFNTQAGIYCGGTANILDCMSFQNAADGIDVNSNSMIARCLVQSNSGQGIAGSSGGEFIDNSIVNNTLAGLAVNANARIVGNKIDSNGNGGTGSDSAGIYMFSSNNNVERNHLVGNKTGIVAAGSTSNNAVLGNVVAHSASGNYSGSTTSWGPIVTTTAGATNPFANISLP